MRESTLPFFVNFLFKFSVYFHTTMRVSEKFYLCRRLQNTLT
ncbi:hypothetical protein HMPREF9073_03173 [Capnocytophaga sp. oral taxon 326 str. F0382]|nr:hypothetical protein HMPREF9073_03173 [Capnocytophaga sp. oral taxon 326 str. F0382]